MGYRPDIENPFSFMTGEIIPKYEKQHKAFEMGITATIEALTKEGKFVERGSVIRDKTLNINEWVNISGYIVFIPEGEL